MSQLVRLKPYNPKRGHVLRKYTFGPTGTKFEEAQGWYVVDDALAARLEGVKQTSDQDGPDAFDVCTEAEAKAIDAKERKERERRGADDATDMTTRDLRRREAVQAEPIERSSVHAPAGRASKTVQAVPAKLARKKAKKTTPARKKATSRARAAREASASPS